MTAIIEFDDRPGPLEIMLNPFKMKCLKGLKKLPQLQLKKAICIKI